MATIFGVRGFEPKIGKDCFIAPNATIVGDVTLGDQCSIWFNVVLRGDVNTITVGDRVNIQDGSVLHTLYEKSTIEIGNDVSIGHNVTLHGCKIHDYALIGMGSIVMETPSSAKALWWPPDRSFCRAPSSAPMRCGQALPPSSSRRSIPRKPRS